MISLLLILMVHTFVNLIPCLSPDGTGQFYVMMSPQDVLQGQRTIAPRAHGVSPRIEVPRGGRDERRRATHNEGNMIMAAFSHRVFHSLHL